MNEEILDESIDDPTLTKFQRKKLKRLASKAERRKGSTKKSFKKWIGVAVVILILIVAIGAFVRFTGTRKVFPPTSQLNHTENGPDRHISDKPFTYNDQVHMLEHADGIKGGPPGIFINYNCLDFDCEDNLIDKLTEIAKDYPKVVYLAPYRNMGAKIVLTKEGEQEIVESFDEEVIRDFVR